MTEKFYGYKLDALGHWQDGTVLETELAAAEFVLEHKGEHYRVTVTKAAFPGRKCATDSVTTGTNTSRWEKNRE